MVWPFKKKEKTLVELEDEMVEKKARLDFLIKLFSNAAGISHHHIGKMEKLSGEVAVLQKNIERLRKQGDIDG